MDACVTYMADHAEADNHEHLLGEAEELPAGHNGLANPRPASIPAHVDILVDVLLLGARDVEEPCVGGVEECDTERKPDAHDPELCHLGHQRSIDVTGGDTKPVTMQHDYSRVRQRQAADSEDRHVALDVKEGHAAEEDDGPRGGKRQPEDTYRVQPGLRLGVGGDAQLRTHDVD